MDFTARYVHLVVGCYTLRYVVVTGLLHTVWTLLRAARLVADTTHTLPRSAYPVPVYYHRSRLFYIWLLRSWLLLLPVVTHSPVAHGYVGCLRYGYVGRYALIWLLFTFEHVTVTLHFGLFTVVYCPVYGYAGCLLFADVAVCYAFTTFAAC